MSGVRSSCEIDSRNSRWRASLDASAPSSAPRASATATTSAGPVVSVTTPRSPRAIRAAVPATPIRGLASQRARTAPATTATTSPMPSARMIRQSDPCAWASTVLRGRASTRDPPPRLARISTRVRPCGPLTVVETRVPNSPSRTSRGGSSSAAAPVTWPDRDTTPASVSPSARLTRELRSSIDVAAGSFASNVACAASRVRASSIDDCRTSCSDTPPVTSTASVATVIVTIVTRARKPSGRRLTVRRPPLRTRRPSRCGWGSGRRASHEPARRGHPRCDRSHSPPGPTRSRAAPRA